MLFFHQGSHLFQNISKYHKYGNPDNWKSSDLSFDISDPNYLEPLNSPWGQIWNYSLQTASQVRFEISDPNYLIIHVHIAYMVPFGSLWGH